MCQLIDSDSNCLMRFSYEASPIGSPCRGRGSYVEEKRLLVHDVDDCLMRFSSEHVANRSDFLESGSWVRALSAKGIQL